MVVLGVNIVLTVMKFVVYRMSGSLAVFAEAWHNFKYITGLDSYYITGDNNLSKRSDPPGQGRCHGYYDACGNQTDCG